VDVPEQTRLDGAAVAHPDIFRVDGVEPREGDGVGGAVAGDAPTQFPEWGDVAAVAVDDDDAGPAVGGQTLNRFADVRAEGVLADPQCPREVAVFLGDADRNRRGDDHFAVVGRNTGVGDGVGGEHVRPERGMRTVLFGASHWQDREVRLHAAGVGPGVFREMHGRAYHGAGLIAGGQLPLPATSAHTRTVQAALAWQN
jgi:hypothetical protein